MRDSTNVDITYGKGPLERNVVPADTLNGSIGNGGLAILQDGSDIDGLPTDRGLRTT